MPETSRVGIQKAGQYLAGQQERHGGFVSYSSASLKPFQTSVVYRTTFVPAIMLGALAGSNEPSIRRVCRKLSAWLVKQRSQTGAFNYWATGAPERKTKPYPDDLDDTFCALIGLQLHRPSDVTSSWLAQIVRLLLATESRVGGPYRTWLVRPDVGPEWQDIDLAVNSNIAYFLRLAAEPVPNLTAMLEQAIKTHTFDSRYYPSWHMVVYYIARAYKGPAAPRLITWILEQRTNGHWGTPLKTALAVSALLQLGHTKELTPAIRALLDAQQPDGSWAAEAFCLDPAQDGKTFYNGSPALTTSLAVEALELHATATLPTPAPLQSSASSTHDTYYNTVISRAATELRVLPSALAEPSLTMLQAMSISSDNREVVLLPLLLADSLDTHSAPLEPEALQQLSLANLYGWMAYMIYDDFLDDEGRPHLLPTANVAQRNSLLAFRRALPDDTEFQAKVAEVFTMIDAANAWEVANCRMPVVKDSLLIGTLPAYGQRRYLAERSLGHALPVLGVLAMLNFTPDSVAAKALERALRHCLIARQLNDDLHDWEADTRNGHSTYVVAAILKKLPLKKAEPLSTLIPQMQQQFWRVTLPDICQTIQHHTKRARQALRLSKVLQEQNALTNMLDGIDKSVARTINEQTKAADFLAAYTENPNPS